MSFSHKAYALDWAAFEEGVGPILEEALRVNDSQPLIAFIELHRDVCTDPYEGQPLTPSWQQTLGARDVQEYADYALTYCYNPADDFGLCEEWSALGDGLPESVRPALLGSALGPFDALFDPGRMGSYFQSPSQVRWSLSALEALGDPALTDYIGELRRVVESNLGLYVTF